MKLIDSTVFDQNRLYLLQYKIKTIKSQYDGQLQSNEHFKGIRYNDNVRISHMILGDIYLECNSDVSAAKNKFLSLNSTAIQPYIEKAVLDSASADYWYENEKDWD